MAPSPLPCAAPHRTRGYSRRGGGVHAALRELLFAHRLYTGEGLPGEARDDGAPAPQGRGHLPEGNPATADAQDTPWPPPLELGATVVLDRMLHRTDREVLRLDTAKVHRSRGDAGCRLREPARRPRGRPYLAPAQRRAARQRPYRPGPVRHGHRQGHCLCTALGRRGRGAQRLLAAPALLAAHPPGAGALAGTLAVSHPVAADGTAGTLAVELALDTAPLRDAARRIRTLGHRD